MIAATGIGYVIPAMHTIGCCRSGALLFGEFHPLGMHRIIIGPVFAAIGMGTEGIALGLGQVLGQTAGAVAVVIGKAGLHGGYRDAQADSGPHRMAPAV